MFASGLPGKRVEANLAGMTATMFSREPESTVSPVDEGCTTNHSMIVEASCYDPQAPMNWKRIATLAAIGGAFVALLARASVAPLPAAVTTRPTTSSVPALRVPEVERLRARLRAPITPASPARNLFAFQRQRDAPAASAPSLPLTLPPAPAMTLPARTPTLALVGLAEDRGPGGPVRTAILSAAGQLYFARVGDIVAGYRVATIDAGSLELVAADDGAAVVLTLK